MLGVQAVLGEAVPEARRWLRGGCCAFCCVPAAGFRVDAKQITEFRNLKAAAAGTTYVPRAERSHGALLVTESKAWQLYFCTDLLAGKTEQETNPTQPPAYALLCL